MLIRLSELRKLVGLSKCAVDPAAQPRDVGLILGGLLEGLMVLAVATAGSRLDEAGGASAARTGGLVAIILSFSVCRTTTVSATS